MRYEDASLIMQSLCRVLTIHNAYQKWGGEDSVVESEAQMLRARGHEVMLYRRDNADLDQMSSAAMAAGLVWSARTFCDIKKQIDIFRPDVVHVHNTLPLISPSAYWAANRAGVPVVQTLHNFRLLCPQAMFLRKERQCEDCLGHLPWRGVLRKCYRGSRSQSAAVVAMLGIHRLAGSYARKVTRYIALSEFSREKFIEGGLPANRIQVKPNFVHDPGIDGSGGRRAGGLFVGRLSAEKGLGNLVQAMSGGGLDPVAVIGSGPEEERLRGIAGIELRGFVARPKVFQQIASAGWLVVPSTWSETFGLVVVEAYACGTPVIASRVGALAELIEDGITGLLVRPGDPRDLAEKMRWAQAHPEEMALMGATARKRYEANYGPEKNYAQLMEIYRDAICAGTSIQ